MQQSRSVTQQLLVALICTTVLYDLCSKFCAFLLPVDCVGMLRTGALERENLSCMYLAHHEPVNIACYCHFCSLPWHGIGILA